MPRRIARHVLADVSPLIRELADAYWSLAVTRSAPRGLVDLCMTAHHLSRPVSDYETPARGAGWLPEPNAAGVYLDKTRRDGEDEASAHAADWQEACGRAGLEPEERDVRAWLCVTDWLGERLTEHGERVGELAGLNVWARTSAGPLVADEAIRAISTAHHAPEVHP